MTLSSTYSFKSAGFKTRNVSVDTIKKISTPPLGIKTPLELTNDGRSSLFNMHYNIEDQINDNLKNLLLTNRGERLGRYDFGASLRELTFELISSENYEEIVMKRISEAVKKYMPFIELESFTSEKINIEPDLNNTYANLSKVSILVLYNIPKLGLSKKGLELIIYAGG